MNFSGNDSRCQLGIEGTYGTAVTPDVQLEFLSESLHQVNTNVESDALVGAVTTPYFNIIGSKVEGDISYEVHPDKMGEILYAALGVEAAAALESGATSAYAHAFTPVKGGDSLPSLSIVEDKKADVFVYSGMKIDTLTLETDAGSLLTSSISLIGQKEEGSGSVEDLSVSALNPFDFNDMKIYFGTAGSVANTNIDEATSMSFSYSNNLENDLYVADGTQYMTEIDYQKRDITFDIETLYNDNTDGYRESNFKTGDRLSVRIEFTHPVEVESGHNYKMTIDLPNCVITEAPNDISGAERLRIPLSFRALEANGDEAVTITLVDDLNGKYSA
jgi:hypothetical protein